MEGGAEHPRLTRDGSAVDGSSLRRGRVARRGMDPPRECRVEACNGPTTATGRSTTAACRRARSRRFRGDPRHRTRANVATARWYAPTGSSWDLGCARATWSSADTYDAVGLDEECDGAPNDGCECIDGDPVCRGDRCRCAAGVQLRRRPQDGEGAIRRPSCNDVDDDCDRAVDEELVRARGLTCRPGGHRDVVPDVGACTGLEVCDGSTTTATGSTSPPCVRVDVGRHRRRRVWTDLSACDGSVGPVSETTSMTIDGTADEGSAHRAAPMRRVHRRRRRAGSGPLVALRARRARDRVRGCADENCDGTVDERCGCV